MLIKRTCERACHEKAAQSVIPGTGLVSAPAPNKLIVCRTPSGSRSQASDLIWARRCIKASVQRSGCWWQLEVLADSHLGLIGWQYARSRDVKELNTGRCPLDPNTVA